MTNNIFTRLNGLTDTRFFLKGVKINERIYNYIDKRLGVVKKILPEILRVEIEIDKEKRGQFRVEVMVKTPYRMYRAEESSKSVEESIDKLKEIFKKQIRRDKDKLLVKRLALKF